MNIDIARQVLDIEARAVMALKKNLDNDFNRIVDKLSCLKGKVVVTGMGKPGFIAQKISATLSSTGTPSFYLHPAEALHGDIGRVTGDDCVMAISNSGETEEILRLLPIIRKIGVMLVAMTGNIKSTLARNADLVLNTRVQKEACPLGLAPTTSTTAMLVMGDAVAVALLKKKGFGEKDFAFYHPGGALGKRLLLKVEDIMRKGAASPVVKENMLVKDVLLKITEARAGSASVVGPGGKLSGIFTDGDLRRHIGSRENIATRRIKDVMTKGPVTIKKHKLAAEAFRIMQSRKIDEIPVVDASGRPVGLLDVQDLLKAGLV